ncbi:MAG: AbrB/MazE/SpoVT family DNA-binding domain-containing protein [Methanobacteriaceae archaeon]
MSVNTKLYSNNQTVVPSEIRKKFHLKADDIIEWNIKEDKKAELTFRKKLTDQDMIGIIKVKEPTNAVELKKNLQFKGDKS